jgi:hypothetical protein
MFYGVIVLNECDLYYEQIIEEGANIEITKKLNTFRKNFKYYINETKKYIEAKDTRKAKYNIQLAKKELEGFKNEVKHMDSDVGSVVFGYMVHCAIDYGKSIPLILGAKGIGAIISNISTRSVPSDHKIFDFFTNILNSELGDKLKILGGKVADLVSWSTKVIDQVKNAIKIINSLRDGDKTEDALNMYRHDLIDIISFYERSLDSLESKIK